MNVADRLQGIMVPLVTPFDVAGDLACENARALIERYLEVGVTGFYVGGSSGEGFLQSVAERCEFMSFVADVVNRRAILIAQVGALSSRYAHALAGFAAESRYDVVSSTPIEAASMVSSLSRIPFKIIGPSKFSRMKLRSFHDTEVSKLFCIHAIKSSRPLSLPSTGAILPS